MLRHVLGWVLRRMLWHALGWVLRRVLGQVLGQVHRWVLCRMLHWVPGQVLGLVVLCRALGWALSRVYRRVLCLVLRRLLDLLLLVCFSTSSTFCNTATYVVLLAVVNMNIHQEGKTG